MWLFDLYFSSILQIWYVEEQISRSISEGPLDFEITGVDCIYLVVGSLLEGILAMVLLQAVGEVQQGKGLAGYSHSQFLLHFHIL